MRFLRDEKKDGLFVDINPLLAEVIRQIPTAADPEDNEAAGGRLFPAPGPANSEMTADWREYVKPGLPEQFEEARSVVEKDLEDGFEQKEGGESFRLRVPLAHTDAWLNGLNQARLVLAAKHDFSDGELTDELPPELTCQREFALYQIAIYGWMQELLLTTMEE